MAEVVFWDQYGRLYLPADARFAPGSGHLAGPR